MTPASEHELAVSMMRLWGRMPGNWREFMRSIVGAKVMHRHTIDGIALSGSSSKRKPPRTETDKGSITLRLSKPLR